MISILAGVAASLGLEVLSGFLASPAAPFVIAGVKQGVKRGAKFLKENPPMRAQEWHEYALQQGGSEELQARNYFGRDGAWHRPR